MKIADMHCDTIMRLYQDKQKGIETSLRENDYHIDLMKLKKSNYLIQCFAMFVQLKAVDHPLETCLEMIDLYYQELEKNSDLIRPVFRYTDLLEHDRTGKMSALLTIEEGGVIQGNLAHLRNLYRLGVRMITLTWNYENGIGFPNINGERLKLSKEDWQKPNTKDGLTPFGIEMVHEMERLGMIVDCSHLSDAGFWDLIRITKKPFIASHSNARTQHNCVRNLTDEMIEALSERGGLIGINYCTNFVSEKQETKVEDLVAHIKHIVSVGGIQCVALGSDFDGIASTLEMKDAGELSKLKEALAEEFTQEEIEKICYKNFLRLCRDCFNE